MKTKNIIKQLQKIRKPIQIITSQYLKSSFSHGESDIKINKHNIIYHDNETSTIKYNGKPHWEEYINEKKLIPTAEGLKLIEERPFEESIYKISIIYKTINSIKQLKEVTSLLDEFYSIIKHTSNTVITANKEKITLGLQLITEIKPEIKKYFDKRKREKFDFEKSKNDEIIFYESTYKTKELEKMINIFSKDNDYMLSKLNSEELINKYVKKNKSTSQYDRNQSV